MRLPDDFVLPPDGVHLRWPDPPLVQERRMHEYKIYAAIAYARANRLNQLVFDSPRPRLGIIACGKAWLDVRQALADIGVDERVAADIGLRLYKVGDGVAARGRRRAPVRRGLQEILVIEEKRQIIEYQLKEMLYGWRDDMRPRVVGKFDDSDEWPAPPHQWLLPPTGELTPAIVARAIAARIARFHDSAGHPRAPGDAAGSRIRRSRRRAPRPRAHRTSAPVVRTTSRPVCRRIRARWPVWAAT